MAKKIWNLMYVAGNPEMRSRVSSDMHNPLLRSEALEAAKQLSAHGWRVWVERDNTKERIFESEAEKKHLNLDSPTTLE